MNNLPSTEFPESARFWKESLADAIPSEWRREIDAFETELVLKKQGKTDDKIFAETRLRRGAYGQRYDNGKRHDGEHSREVGLPQSGWTKGPDTLWNAPGMQRIKLPYGGITPRQLEVIADLAEEYSDSIIHITTRQDIQLHYIHLDNTPSLFRRLAAVGITTQEACGNSLRNITACPIAGVCRDQAFDVTGYAHALFEYFLGHPDIQDFGRKFKIALSGCKQHPCGLANMHDLGLIACTREVEGRRKRGFELYVGGGLGAIPYPAKLFEAFIPEEDLLGMVQAIFRVYARLGEKKKRFMARIKFLVAKLGIEEFRRLVLEERARLPHDPGWTAFLKELDRFDERPGTGADQNEPAKPQATHSRAGAHSPGDSSSPPAPEPGFEAWAASNVRQQAQEGYCTATIHLPLGDLSSSQARALATLLSRYHQGTLRTTVEQNILLRWIRAGEVHSLYRDLKAIYLAEPGGETIVDITACPGTDTCKLGIASSRGLAAVLRNHLAERNAASDAAIQNIKIKASGCFNSCGQHHLADIGFYGISRNINGFAVPHFQLHLGGEFARNGASYGLAVGGFPSKAIPEVVDRLTEWYRQERNNGESFKAFTDRQGKKTVLQRLRDLVKVPTFEMDPGFYTDWGDIRVFSMQDKGIGECAGEVVTLTDFGLKKADREHFEAQVLIDDGEYARAADKAYDAMKHAAQALLKRFDPDISDDADTVMAAFRPRFFDTGYILDPFGGERFVQYYFHAHQERSQRFDSESAQRRVEEARLFVEAAHSCNLRLPQQQVPAA